ncbi:MAG TPA: bifunctional ornithine acetyltransferase/N-acetylglutamate synthase [Candidatus Limnocylindrales bacterium]
MTTETPKGTERDRALTELPSDLPAVTRTPVVPRGFVVGGATAGIKASGRPDLAVVATEPGADGSRPRVAAAAVFTSNAVAAAPVRVSRAHLAATGGSGGGWGTATAIVATSGSANAATGAAGDADQARIAAVLGDALGASVEQVLCLSTGLIGTRLPVDRVTAAIGSLVPRGLAATPDALTAAAESLRTTDSRTKIATTSLRVEGEAGDATLTVTGIAKGVGMIHPRMATMLAILLTDAAVEPATLHGLLRGAAARTWDQLSVDGDTSTNDTVFLLASATAGKPIAAGSEAAATLGRAIEAVARDLARQQAADGEGATTLVTCQVSGAVDDAEARAVARTVISSSLVKAAVHGRDPNWGRIAGAAGNARLADAPVLVAGGLAARDAEARAGKPASVDPDRLRIAIGGHLVFDGAAGGPIAFDREAARASMDAPEILIRLDLGLGSGSGEAFGCDLTEAYVIENSEYST